MSSLINYQIKHLQPDFEQINSIKDKKSPSSCQTIKPVSRAWIKISFDACQIEKIQCKNFFTPTIEIILKSDHQLGEQEHTNRFQMRLKIKRSINEYWLKFESFFLMIIISIIANSKSMNIYSLSLNFQYWLIKDDDDINIFDIKFDIIDERNFNLWQKTTLIVDHLIFISWNIWEKQLIRLAGGNFGCHKTHRFKPKLVLQVEQTT